MCGVFVSGGNLIGAAARGGAVQGPAWRAGPRRTARLKAFLRTLRAMAAPPALSWGIADRRSPPHAPPHRTSLPGLRHERRCHSGWNRISDCSILPIRPMDVFTPEKRSAVMRAVKGADTGPEMVVRRIVHRMGYRYGLHCKDLPGRPDLVFRRLGKVVFVHGCFWHGHRCPAGRIPSSRATYWAEKLASNKRRDRRHQAALKSAGWQVLVVWECELRDTERLERRLRRFLAAK